MLAHKRAAPEDPAAAFAAKRAAAAGPFLAPHVQLPPGPHAGALAHQPAAATYQAPHAAYGPLQAAHGAHDVDMMDASLKRGPADPLAQATVKRPTFEDTAPTSVPVDEIQMDTEDRNPYHELCEPFRADSPSNPYYIWTPDIFRPPQGRAGQGPF